MDIKMISILVIVTVITCILNIHFFRKQINSENKTISERVFWTICPGFNVLTFLAFTWIYIEDLKELSKTLKKEVLLVEDREHKINLDTNTKEKIKKIFEEHKISARKLRRSLFSNLLYRATGGKSDYLFLETLF